MTELSVSSWLTVGLLNFSLRMGSHRASSEEKQQKKSLGGRPQVNIHFDKCPIGKFSLDTVAILVRLSSVAHSPSIVANEVYLLNLL